MATASIPRSGEGLECPVCMELMSVPIYNCMSGHSLCNTCTVRLPTPKCPICREDMTQIRNRHLEELVGKVEAVCPNKAAGCVYKVKPAAVADHLRECIFRDLACPHGAVFGKCSWEGKLKDMQEHFAARHGDACGASPDEDVVLDDVSADVDDRRLFLVINGKAHFIVTVKIDTSQKMAFWCVQNIGPKVSAHQWLYEVHVTSQADPHRKLLYIDHCFNDAVKPEEVFRMGKCAMLPLPALATFLKNKRLAFQFSIKRGGAPPAKENRKPAGGGGGTAPPAPPPPAPGKKQKGKQGPPPLMKPNKSCA